MLPLFQDAVDRQDLVSLLEAALRKLKQIASKYTSKSALGKGVYVFGLAFLYLRVLQIRLFLPVSKPFLRRFAKGDIFCIEPYLLTHHKPLLSLD